jgi:mRNA-degrading endonuclease YafQ of YafQ-DinJ toxin-antitoxin module
MKIYYLGSFLREYKKLDIRIKKLAQEKEVLFRIDPFDNRLKIHKLLGEFEGYWAFSITNKDRIIFEIGKEGVFYFHRIGDHDIYD